MTVNPETKDLDHDVQIIREILFGQQLGDILERIKSLESQVSALKQEKQALEKRLVALSSEVQSQHRTDARELEALAEQVAGLSSTFEDQLAGESDSLRKSLNNYKRTVGRRFSRMEKATDVKLADIQSLQDNLISSLAGALSAYRREPELDEAAGD